MQRCGLPTRVFLASTLTAGACASAEKGSGPPPANLPTPPPPAGAWTLVWSDEFEGPAGATVDATKWVADIGGNGWGNQELEYYTDRARNAHLSGDGSLVLEALRETFTGPDRTTREYTSARLKTQRRFEHAYGRFEARIQLPRGQGLWPAFWMLGSDINFVSWPSCGEIDIMESIGREPGTVHGSIHGPGYSGGGAIGSPHALPGGERFADGFHVFAMEWEREPPVLRWYVDDTSYQTRTPADLPAGKRWVFDHPFFLLLNLAVGGTWPGSPDATTEFPQAMRVDYVRVYSRGGA